MKRGLVLLILILVFVTACGRIPQGERPQDTAAVLRAVQTGTQGVQINTIPRYPPETLYDLNPLIALVEVRNRGNYDLDPQQCFIQVTGFDPNILGRELQGPRSCATGYPQLEGKNVYNTEGGFNQLEFRSTNVKLPPSVYEYNPTLNFVACYNYHTKASPQVCVDPVLYQITSEQKSCIPQDVSMGGGQGAPVSVSFVGVNMVGTKAIFEINIANQGGGKVLSPNAPIQQCGTGNIEYVDLDKVQYAVQLSGGSLINCKPQDGYVRLVNGRGKIVCSFNIPAGPAYETPLLIDLDYGYIDSFTKPIKIIQTPQ